MAAASFAPEIMEKIKHVTSLPYAEQAKFYLNAFWAEGADQEAETVWGLCEAFEKEDNVKGKEGNELNPIQAFHLLQQRNETLTALELKAQLRKVDIDANGEMALAEYLLFINNRDPTRFITNPQGNVDPEQLREAEERITSLTTAFDNLTVQLDNQKKTEADAKAAEEVAVKAEDEAKASEAKLKAAEEEVRKVEEEAQKVADEIKAQEDAHNAEIDRLTALSTDTTVGIVKRNTAVQQLAQLKGTDPLPLQKAKLTQEAVVRRLAKATQAAAAETAIASEKRSQAEADRAAAEQKRAAAEEATKQVEAAIDDIKVQIAEAEEAFNKLKSQSGSPQGALWWNSRIIEEKKKYLPQRFQ